MEKGGRKEGEKHMRLPLMHPLLATWQATQECAQTED